MERTLPGWVVGRVGYILDAWGRAPPEVRRRAEREAVEAGAASARRVGAELGALFALPVARQRSTPLEIVRSAYREPTAVLRAAEVPPRTRDGFDERSWPDDDYGLVPRTFGDLGDESLAHLHLAWGLAKAALLRESRSDESDPRG